MAYSQDRLMLPWTVERQENNNFRAVLAILATVFLVLAVWIPSVHLPEPDRETLEKLPPQLAKLVVKKEPVKPKLPEPKKEEKPKKEEPKKEEKPEPVKKKEPKKEIIKKPVEKTAQKIKKAREVARKTGLLALQNDLAELQSSVDLSSLKTAKTQVRSEKTLAAKAEGISSKQVTQSSGGISTDDLSAPAETIQLASRDVTALEETDQEQALAEAEANAAARANIRSDESIRIAIEGLKNALYKLYNRELRKDPFLEGAVMFELTIDASGEVSVCTIINSELNNPALERKFINRIRLYNFGAEAVDTLVKKININFIPQ